MWNEKVWGVVIKRVVKNFPTHGMYVEVGNIVAVFSQYNDALTLKNKLHGKWYRRGSSYEKEGEFEPDLRGYGGIHMWMKINYSIDIEVEVQEIPWIIDSVKVPITIDTSETVWFGDSPTKTTR